MIVCDYNRLCATLFNVISNVNEEKYRAETQAFPIRKYSSSYLMSKRYSNRSLNIDCSSEVLAKKLNIYKYFDPKRGRKRKKVYSKEARPLKEGKLINVIDVITLKGRKNKMWRKESDIKEEQRKNLRQIKIERTLYEFPKMMYSNVRSLHNKFDEVQAYLLHEKADVGIFAETWMNEMDLNGFNMDGFNVIHRLRKRSDKTKGGGVSIYVSVKLTVQSTRFPIDDEVEALSVMFRPNYLPKCFPWIAIVAVYNPPDNPFSDKLIDFIGDEIDRLQTINKDGKIFVVGDFNSLCTGFISRNSNFKQIVNKPTRRNNVLDKVFFNGNSEYLTDVYAPISTSDHNVVIIKSKNMFCIGNETIELMSRPRRKSNYMAFGKIISEFDWSNLYGLDDINDVVDLFNDIIVDLYENCFPVVKKYVKEGKKNWFNKDISRLIKDKNRFYESNDLLKVNEISMDIKSAVREAKEKESVKFLNSIKYGSRDFHRIIRECSGVVKKFKPISFPNKNQLQSAMEIFEYFADLANSHPGKLGKNVSNYSISDMPKVSSAWVMKRLRDLKEDAVTPPDRIPNFILKEFYVELCEPIAFMLNMSVVKGVCPNAWKNSFLLTFPKVKNPKKACEMRPISIASALSKICEKFIQGLIMPEIIRYIDKNQYGGIPGRNANQYMVKYIDQILKISEAPKQKSASIIMDYEKAFDNVDHVIFLNQLNDMKVSGYIVKWIESFLFERRQILKLPVTNKEISFICSNGVPQGSVLGGLVYIVTTNKIAEGS